jgi:hypothetical protein
MPFGNNNFLALLHRKIGDPCYEYSHMLVQFDNDLKIVKCSDPFTFEGYPVEFGTGLVVNEHMDLCVLSYGVMDRLAILLELKLSDIAALLKNNIGCAQLAHIIPRQRNGVSEISKALARRTDAVRQLYSELGRQAMQREQLQKEIDEFRNSPCSKAVKLCRFLLARIIHDGVGFGR